MLAKLWTLNFKALNLKCLNKFLQNIYAHSMSRRNCMLKYPLHFQPCLDLGETLAQVGQTYLYKSIVWQCLTILYDQVLKA